MSAHILTPIQPVQYGAKELQTAIRRNTYRSLFFAVAMLFLVSFTAWLLRAKPEQFTKDSIILSIIPVQAGATTDRQKGDDGDNDKQPPPPQQQKPLIDPTQGTLVPTTRTDTIPQQSEDPSPKNTGITTDPNGPKTLGTGGGGNDPRKEGPDGGTPTGTSTQINNEPWDQTTVDIEPAFEYQHLLSKLQYPETARRMGLEGYVGVKVLVGADGSVLQAQIQDSENTVFNNAALEAVRRTQFSAAKQSGQSVACWILIPINFRLR